MRREDERSKPVVTVLMAVRNTAGFLGDAIESIRSQSRSDWELVVVDDASDDGSHAILEGFAGDDARVRVIRRSSVGGPYVAANEGLAVARGRYIARMDADDISLPDRLERQVRFLERHPELRACASDARILAGDDVLPLRIIAMPTLPGAVRWGVCVRGFLQGAALVETDAFREIGGYRELPAAQDHRLWCDLSRRRWLGSFPEVVLLYRKHDEQISETRLATQRRLAAEAVVEHIGELTGDGWTVDDVMALRSLGFGDVRRKIGAELIRRFEAMWEADATLTMAERRELVRFTRRLRVAHAKQALRRWVAAHRAGRALLRAYTRLHSR